MTSKASATSASASGSSATTARKPTKKKSKQEEEEERLAREAAEAALLAAAKPPSPFDRIDEIWALDGQFAAQRAKVGEIFEIEDGPGVCAQSLSLDDVYSHLHFARTLGLNLDQTRLFFDLMQELRRLFSEDATVSSADGFRRFKEKIMQHTDVKVQAMNASAAAVASTNAINTAAANDENAQSTNPTQKDTAAPSPPTTTKGSSRPPSSTSPQPSSSAARPNSRGGAGGSTNKKLDVPGGGSGANRSASSSPRGGPSQPPIDDSSTLSNANNATSSPATPTTLFTVAHVKSITEYVLKGYIQHWRLYQAAFNHKMFQPRKHEVIQHLLLESYVPPVDKSMYNLDSAVDLTSEMARRAERERQKAEEEEKQQPQEENASTSGVSSAAVSRPGTSSGQGMDQLASRLSSLNVGSEGGGSAGGDTSVEPDPDDEIGVLVHQHMKQAREQMMKLIKQNEVELDARIRVVENKLTATNPANATPRGSKQGGMTSAKKR